MKEAERGARRVDDMTTGPLAGMVVLDLSRVLAGPYCTMVLRDLGARVIKIERPGVGDDSRHFPPFVEENGDSGYFITINRGKESVAVDFSTVEGRELVLSLAEQADVLVENFSPKTLEQRGLGPQVLLERNPRLVIGRLSGYGQTGPDCDLPAYDITVQARSGLMAITGPEGGGPVKIGSAISDIGGGLFCALGIMAALLERNVSGLGQIVDLSMLDASVSLLENSIVRRSVAGYDPRPIGQRHPSITPFDGYRCADGVLVVGAGNDTIFQRFVRSVDRLEWLEDPRFSTNDARTEHQAELKEAIEEVLCGETAAHWLAHFREAEVPCAKIQGIQEVMQDPQVLARGLVETYHHPASGRQFEIVASPFGNLSRTPGASASWAPDLGEHTRGVLAEFLGYTEAQLAELVARQVVAVDD